MTRNVKGRPYDSTGRRARSRVTRSEILGAARELIVEHGYNGTTIAAIAERARVNADTVYELVGRKPLILRELIELALSGTDTPVVAEERDYVRRILAESNPKEKLRIYAAAVRRIQGRLAPLFLALRDAAATDPDAKTVWLEISSRRAANMRKLARHLHDLRCLRKGLTTGEAADILWVTNSSELYVLLTSERGWSDRHYERWLAITWQRLLLPSELADDEGI
jgi:AcrR family transcriptional regulator